MIEFAKQVAGTFFGTVNGAPTAGMIMLGLLVGGLVSYAGERLLITTGRAFYATMFKTGMEIAAVFAVLGSAIALLVKIFKLALGDIN